MKLPDIIRTRLAAARRRHEEGKLRTGLLLWLLGVPLPIILLIWAIKGCA
jgi:hypothetical protein